MPKEEREKREKKKAKDNRSTEVHAYPQVEPQSINPEKVDNTMRSDPDSGTLRMNPQKYKATCPKKRERKERQKKAKDNRGTEVHAYPQVEPQSINPEKVDSAMRSDPDSGTLRMNPQKPKATCPKMREKRERKKRRKTTEVQRCTLIHKWSPKASTRKRSTTP